MHKIIVPALAALSLAAFAAPASAEMKSVPVKLADIDLNSPSGMDELEGRIRGAVARICGRTLVRKVADGLDQKRGVEQATASAWTEVARINRDVQTVALNR